MAAGVVALCASAVPAAAQELRLEIRPAEIETSAGNEVAITPRLLSGHEVRSARPWDFRFEAAAGSFRGNLYKAPDEPGRYRILVRHDASRLSAEAFVSVRFPRPVASIRVEPESAQVEPGGTAAFRAVAIDESGVEMTFRPLWAATGGTIDEQGTFKAGRSPGFFEVRAAGPGAPSGRAQVSIVVPESERETLSLSPSSAEVRPEGRVVLTVRLAKGGQASTVPPWEVEFQVTAGRLEGNVWSAPPENGEYVVTARKGELAAEARFTVALPPTALARLRISPEAPTVRTGDTVSFAVEAETEDGRPVETSPVWKAGGGEIGPDGVFVAGREPGEYEVAVADPASRATARTTVKVVRREAVRLEVSPAQATVVPGQIAPFSARALDDRDEEVPSDPEWSASGGTIDAQGRYRPGDEYGESFEVRARDRLSGLICLAKVSIVPKPAVRVEVDPASARLAPGGTAAFAARAFDEDGREIPASFEWKTTGGRVEKGGLFRAPDGPGEFQVVAVEPGSGKSASVKVSVVREPVPAAIELAPDRVELAPGGTVRFTARVLDESGRELSIQPEFRAEGGELAADGTYRAGEVPGESYRVYAFLKEPALSAHAEVVIVAPRPTAYRLVLEPARATVDPDDTVTFQATLYAGEERVHVWPWDFHYEADEGRFHGKVYRAPTLAGTYKVRVRHERGTAEGEVVVRPGPVARIVVEPAEVTLASGESARFSARAFDAHDNEVAAEFLWRATGGEIRPDGTFVAGGVGGRKYEVTAGVSGSTAVGKAQVEVRAPRTRFRLELAPAQAEVLPGETVRFRASLFQDDRPVEAAPSEIEFSAVAGSFRGDQYYPPDRPGTYEITARHRRAEASATVVVQPSTTPVASFALEPASATVRPGEEVRFKAVAKDSAGKEVKVPVRWTAFGGSIDETGVYRAPAEVGDYVILAEHPGSKREIRAQVSVRVPAAARLVVEPAEVKARPGQRVEFKVTLFEGTRERIVWPWDLRFSAGEGTFEGATYIAPTKPGAYRIEVHHRLASAAATVTVVAPAIIRIEIEPREVRLRPGERQKFAASCTNEHGNQVALAVEWKATGGEIDEAGLFTAGAEVGTFSVDAVEPQSGVRASVRVVVRSETRFLGVGRRWGEDVKKSARSSNDLVNYLIANVFFRDEGEMDDFRQGFVEGHGPGGEQAIRDSWHTVLSEFGKYYGREFRKQSIGLSDAAGFVKKHVLPRPAADLEAFRAGFLAGHQQSSGEEDFERILTRARQ